MHQRQLKNLRACMHACRQAGMQATTARKPRQLILHAADRWEANTIIAITMLGACVHRTTDRQTDHHLIEYCPVFLSLGDTSRFILPPSTCRCLVCAPWRPVTGPQRIISDNRERNCNIDWSTVESEETTKSSPMASGLGKHFIDRMKSYTFKTYAINICAIKVFELIRNLCVCCSFYIKVVDNLPHELKFNFIK